MKKRTVLSMLVISSFFFTISCNNQETETEAKHDSIKDFLVKSNHTELKKASENTIDLLPIEIGKKFAVQTKEVLGKNLINAINTKGTENALNFCSVKAYPLTDSMALALNAQIKRVSDKNRNPKNSANKRESAYISKSKKLLENGEEIIPKMSEVNGKLVGYYPIMTNKMCLQCHGNPNTEILPKTISQIKKLYTNDRAIGYKVNELRGIWVVEMNKK